MAAGVPKPLGHALIDMGTPVKRDDPCLVHLLLDDGHESARLHDLVVIVVSGRNSRQRGAYDASRVQIEILRTIVRTVGANGFIPAGLSLPGFWS